MKLIVILIGTIFGYLLITTVINIYKSIRAKKWKITTGKLTKWNIYEEADSEDIKIIIKELTYSYNVNNKEYESNKRGFGFPNSGSILSIQNTLTEIFENAPELQVCINPLNPEISVLAVGFNRLCFFHLLPSLSILCTTLTGQYMNNKLDIDSHMRSFAESFVLQERKEKWVDLLQTRPENILTLSSKLFNYLDHNFIEQDDSLNNVTAQDTIGVFYDFKSEPKCISFKNAIEEAKDNDAIFSINPGKLAVYFYHEGWNFVCKK